MEPDQEAPEKPEKGWGGGVEAPKEEPAKEIAKEPEKDPAAPDPKVEADRLRAENEELKTFAKGAAKRAQDAETFVSNLTGRLERVAASAQQQRGEPGGDPKERLRERIAEDPASVLDEHYQARTQPLVRGFLDQQGRMNRELFITRMNQTEDDREVLKAHLEDVDDFLKDFEPEHRASPDAYDAALRWVLSKPENFKKEVARQLAKEREKNNTHFVEPGTKGERQPREGKKQLSSIEQEVAKGLGLSDEDYMKYKEV